MSTLTSKECSICGVAYLNGQQQCTCNAGPLKTTRNYCPHYGWDCPDCNATTNETRARRCSICGSAEHSHLHCYGPTNSQCPDPYCCLSADHDGDHDDTPLHLFKSGESNECPHCRAVYEIWAGSEGMVPETASEAYQERLIQQMRDAAKGGLAQKAGEQCGPYCPQTQQPCERMCQTICNQTVDCEHEFVAGGPLSETDPRCIKCHRRWSTLGKGE